MSGISTIYLVRHGECKANVEEMNLSPEIDVITEKGLVQSKLLGEHLQNVTFTQAYASTYPRAEYTARKLLAHLTTPTPDLILDERIREREMGDFENRPMKDVFTALFSAAKDKGVKMVDFEVPGGESVENLESRIASFLESLLKTIREAGSPQNVLVVTHGVIILRIMLKLRAWSKDPSKNLILNNFAVQPVIIPIKNTAYHVLTVDTSKQETVIDLSKVHQADHLAPLKPAVPVPPSQDIQEITTTFMQLVEEQCAIV